MVVPIDRIEMPLLVTGGRLPLDATRMEVVCLWMQPESDRNASSACSGVSGRGGEVVWKF